MYATAMLSDPMIRLLCSYQLDLLRGATLAQLVAALDGWPATYVATVKA